MKRKKSLIILAIVLVVVVTASCIVGCSINGFKEDDFELNITNVKIDGNNVTITAELKNNSFRNGLVSSSGLIHIFYTDENGQPDNWGVASVLIYNWIRCKQKLTLTNTFELEKGTYTIEAVSVFSCNKKQKDRFVYSATKIIEV